MAEKPKYPTFSEKNWWTLRQQFKASIPNAVVTNYVKSLFSLTSNDAANRDISTLKRLKLVDEDGKPTPLANEWRIDESYKSACDKILLDVYPPDLLDLFLEKDIERAKVKNWFMSQCSVGDNSAGQMAALFMLLRKGEIKEQKPTNAKQSINNQAKVSSKQVVTVANNLVSTERVSATEQTSLRESRVSPSQKPNLHIDLQIHISPESTPEQIESIFECMAKYIYGIDNS